MTAPSRTAAIGSIRVARIAGRRLASTAIRVPMPRLTTIVRIEKTSPPLGRSMPSDSRSDIRPTAIPSPRKSPITEPTRPIASDSRMTDPSTCRREAPSVRSVASSRIRCATVIASVLAITKLPTNSAMPPKPSRKYLMMFRPSWVSALSSRACAAAVFTCIVSESSGSIWLDELGLRHAFLGADADQVELALLVEQPLGGREVEDGDR